jgi:hypothetical protein
MIVRELIARLGLTPAAGAAGFERAVRGGYCGDLLSEVMAHAPPGCVWATVQGHPNIIAVALLREMAAVVVAGGRPPDAETLAKADREGIPLLTAGESVYVLVGRMHAVGIGGAPAD